MNRSNAGCVLLFYLTALAAGCDPGQAAPEKALASAVVRKSPPAPEQTPASAPAGKPVPAAAGAVEQAKGTTATGKAPEPLAPDALSDVARIVFIDQEGACECTRKRIEGTWTALQSALGEPAGLPVERIHADTQAGLAAPYVDNKPLMVPPGVYFVDDGGAVIQMLQGEVTAEQIAAVLRDR